MDILYKEILQFYKNITLYHMFWNTIQNYDARKLGGGGGVRPPPP